MLNLLLVLTVFCCFGLMFSVSKMALMEAPPLALTAIRMFLAGLLLLTYQGIANPKKLIIRKQDWPKIFLLAILSFYLTNVLEYWGLQSLSAAHACFIYSLTPFFTAIVGYFFEGEKMTPFKWLGMSIGLSAMVPVLMIDDPHTTLGFSIISMAELAVMASTLCSVFGWLILKSLARSRGDHGLISCNGLSMLFAGLICFVHTTIQNPSNPLPIRNWPNFLLFVSLMILLSNVISYNLYGYLLKKFSATFMAFAGLTTPLFASLWGKILLKEAIPDNFFLSLAAITLGLTIFYREEWKDLSQTLIPKRKRIIAES